MKFLNYSHEQRFRRLCDEFSNFKKNDKAAMSILYIMSGNESIENIIKKSFKSTSFSFSKKMFESVDLSEGEYVLLSLAAALFDGSKNVNVTDFSVLEGETFQLAVNALTYRYEPVKGIYEVDSEPLIIEENKTKKYVSQQQIAEMMNDAGIKGDRRKVSVYIKNGYLPEPSVYVGTAPGWTEGIIREWIRDYEAGKIVSRRKR